MQGTFAAALGVYLGLLVYRTGSLWAPILGHMALNTTSVLASFGGVEQLETEYLSVEVMLLPFIAVGAGYLLYRMPFDRAATSPAR